MPDTQTIVALGLAFVAGLALGAMLGLKFALLGMIGMFEDGTIKPGKAP